MLSAKQGNAMAYRIVYYRDGREIGSTPWSDTLEATKQIASDGLIRHQANMARIIDVDGSGAEVASVVRDDNADRT